MANKEHLDQLMKGHDNWNLWRRENLSVEPDLSKANLENFSLSNNDLRLVNFRGSNLSGSNINKALLDRANFDGANLCSAYLSGVDLRSTIFGNATLEAATLSCSNLSNVDLSHVNLRKANLQGAELNQVNLRCVDLSYCNLSLAKLNGAYLNEAILVDANLNNADLRKADLRGANLKNANLSKAFLHETEINEVTFLEKKWFFVWEVVNKKTQVKNLSGAELSQVNFSGADLSYIDFSRANLSEANLSEVNFRGANLSRANLHSANLHKSNFLEADLKEANLSSADLSSTDMSGMDVSGTFRINLKGANLFRACLVKANLFSAKMFRVNLRETDLRQANLTEANLFKADLSKANLEQSNLIRLQAVETNFTEARLTGSCIKDWNISKANLNNVDCQYICLNSFNKERCPIDREFESGEFTKRFQISQNILEVVFSNGVPWQSFAYAFHEVNLRVLDEYGDELFLREYKVLGDGLVVLKISYPYNANGIQIQEELQKKTNQLEHKVSSLEGEIKAKDEALLMMERMLSTRKSEADNNEPRRIYIDDIDSFKKVKNIDTNSITHLLGKTGRFERSEDEIQVGLEKILSEQFHKKDWGGEYNDLYTSNLIFQGNRKSAAFLLKGKGEKSPTMEITHCGKNGDQLVRLLESPAEIFFVQFVGNISESLIKDIDGKIELHRYKGQQSYYCVINGSDTARLMYAYDLIEK